MLPKYVVLQIVANFEQRIYMKAAQSIPADFRPAT